MENFGLGLVLSFTDDASHGIKKAVNSLEDLTNIAESAGKSFHNLVSLSAFSHVAMRVGSATMRAGRRTLDFFKGLVGRVTEVGQELFSAEMQLGKLYESSGRTGKEVIDDISQYAQKSIFNFQDLIPAVSMLKSVGIEAFDNIASSTGKANQSLLDYASDLAAFKPNMRNMYGRGVKAAMGAIGEYISEGNIRFLKSGAGLDITGILGEDKGKTIEDRARQIADLLEKLNMVGMTASLAGTPMQRLSNMGDVLFTLIGKISDSGVYQKFTDLVAKLSDWVFSIPQDELDSLAQNIGSALTTIMRPMDFIIDRVIFLGNAFRNLVKQYPKILKIVSILGIVGGGLLVASGVFLLVAGSIGYLALMLKGFSGSFGIISSTIRMGVLQMLGILLPFVATLGVLFMAWKNDMWGIQTKVTEFIDNVVGSFQHARSVMSGSIEDIRSTLAELDTNNPFENLTLSLMKFMGIVGALGDIWSDYELSEDNFVLINELGILPLIRNIMMLKFRLEKLGEGFIQGFENLGTKVKDKIKDLMSSLNFDMPNIPIFNLFDRLANMDSEEYIKIGERIGDITGKVVMLGMALGAIAKLAPVIMGIGKILIAVFGAFAGGPIVALIIGVAGALVLLYQNSETFRNFVDNVFGKLKEVFEYLMPYLVSFGNTLGSLGKGTLEVLIGLFNAVAPTIVDVVKMLGGFVYNVFTLLVDTLVDIGTSMYQMFESVLPMLKVIAEALSPIIQALMEVVGIIVARLIPIFQTILSVVAFVFKSAFKIISLIIPIVVQIVATIIRLLAPIVSTIVRAVGVVVNVILGIVQVVIQVIGAIIENIGNLVHAMVAIGTSILSIILTVITGITEFIGLVIQVVLALVDGILEAINVLWNSIVTIFSGVVGFLSGAFQAGATKIMEIFIGVRKFFENLWNGIVKSFNQIGTAIAGSIRTAINSVLSGAVGLVNGFVRGINSAIGVINKIPGVEIGLVGELSVPKLAKGGIVDNPTLSLVGEAGREAVIPLENNKGWIRGLAKDLVTEVDSATNYSSSPVSRLKPITQSTTTTNYQNTSSSNFNITLEEGAVQIVTDKLDTAEVDNLVNKILDRIKRKLQLDRMFNYQPI